MKRTILHSDCNGFYASVECVRDPSLREVPMAVCGDPQNRHGIILAKNELAKQCGVQTAETIWQARRKCPELRLVPPHREDYEEFSRRVNAIYARYTDRVEPFGIDESWLDVTGSERLFGDGRRIADTLRRVVREETGLTISVGVSFNKIFAKLGSDYKKPDATTVITEENFRERLFPLPAGTLLYVGGRAAETLRQKGIYTIGDLAAADPQYLTHLFGKIGEMFHRYANGLDDSPVKRIGEEREIQSIGNGMTFSRDLESETDVRTGVQVLVDMVAARLREQGIKCRTVQVIIKDTQLRSISRQQPLARATDLAGDLIPVVMQLIGRCWTVGKPIRMLTITGLQLTDQDDAVQLSFFEADAPDEHDKRERLESTLDHIRRRFGKGAILPGSVLHNDLGIGEAPSFQEERTETAKDSPTASE